MQRRYLGSTGMSVNDTALGTMMFGAWGNTDRAETVRMVHRANRRRHRPDRHRGRIRGRRDRGGSWARRCRAAAKKSCWRPSSACQTLGTPTIRAHHPDGFAARSRPACAGCAPTTSISISCIATTGTQASTKPLARSPTYNSRGSFGHSATHHFLSKRSSKRSGSPSGVVTPRSSPSNRPTQLSAGPSRYRCYPQHSAMTWAFSPTAHWVGD
jgi:hypothetical protein